MIPAALSLTFAIINLLRQLYNIIVFTALHSHHYEVL